MTFFLGLSKTLSIIFARIPASGSVFLSEEFVMS